MGCELSFIRGAQPFPRGEGGPPSGGSEVECGQKRWIWYAETDLVRPKVSAGLKRYRKSSYLPSSTPTPFGGTLSPGEGLWALPRPAAYAAKQQFTSAAKKPGLTSGLWVYFAAFRAFRSSLVRVNRSSSGIRIRQIRAAVKPPLYRQKPPCRVGTEVTSR